VTVGSLLRKIGRPVRRLLRSTGFDIVRYLPDGGVADPRAVWMRKLGIDLVLDVGANSGQFVGWIRDRDFAGRIISFEPLSRTYAEITRRWGKDPRWTGIRCALGEQEGKATMQVAGNDMMSSSLLGMLSSHTDALPESAIVGQEEVDIRRLDKVLPEHIGRASSLYLKVDTQGYELPVILGAGEYLKKVALLEVELSLTPLYEGQALMPDVWNRICAMGFEPVWIDQGFTDWKEMKTLQIDALFVARSKL